MELVLEEVLGELWPACARHGLQGLGEMAPGCAKRLSEPKAEHLPSCVPSLKLELYAPSRVIRPCHEQVFTNDGPGFDSGAVADALHTPQRPGQSLDWECCGKIPDVVFDLQALKVLQARGEESAPARRCHPPQPPGGIGESGPQGSMSSSRSSLLTWAACSPCGSSV